MSVILGINAYHAGASAAVLIDGLPVVAIAEERLNRKKYYAGFPKLAIQACLEQAGLKLSDVDAVAIGRDPAANRRQKVSFALAHPAGLLNFRKIAASRGMLGDLKSLIADGSDADPATLRFKPYYVEHHLAHIASSYYISGWDQAAGFSADGSGDFVTCMFARCEGNTITPIRRIFIPHSLGTFYMMVCQFIGYSRYGDEGKVMGLAPLGRDVYGDLFDEVLKLRPNGIELDKRFFMPLGARQGLAIGRSGEMKLDRMYSDELIRLLGDPRAPSSEITQRDMDLAFGVQRAFEKAYFHLLRILHRDVPATNVAISGGCALNSVANGKIFDQTPFTHTSIQSASGDEGLAMGAALFISNSVFNEERKAVNCTAYLGPEFSDWAVRAALKQHGIAHEVRCPECVISETAAEIANGKVVGWFQGRMEWGPRALGNRSILAHPGRGDMKDILNARIKHRESFRPFAPAVLIERQGEIFEHSHPSPHMLHVYKIRPHWRDRLKAVNHVDDTGRLQSVAREENPRFYDLIKAFEQRTGIPVILNTSFNENEPVVCTPEQAIACYQRTKMDVLTIGNYICRKSQSRQQDY